MGIRVTLPQALLGTAAEQVSEVTSDLDFNDFPDDVINGDRILVLRDPDTAAIEALVPDGDPEPDDEFIPFYTITFPDSPTARQRIIIRYTGVILTNPNVTPVDFNPNYTGDAEFAIIIAEDTFNGTATEIQITNNTPVTFTFINDTIGWVLTA